MHGWLHTWASPARASTAGGAHGPAPTSPDPAASTTGGAHGLVPIQALHHVTSAKKRRAQLKAAKRAAAERVPECAPERAPDPAGSTTAGAMATAPCDGVPDFDASSCSDASLDDDVASRSMRWGAPAAADDDVDGGDDGEEESDEFDDEGIDRDGCSRWCSCGFCDRCRDRMMCDGGMEWGM